MKYCPYCGADLIDSECSFCTECGKTLPTVEGKTMPVNGHKRHRKTSTHTKTKVLCDESKSEDDYDGYYDDIIPDDNGTARQALDKALIKKIVFLIIGLLIIVGACVAIMYLL